MGSARPCKGRSATMVAPPYQDTGLGRSISHHSVPPVLTGSSEQFGAWVGKNSLATFSTLYAVDRLE